MAVTIGHASIDENQKANSGAAGDQTKKEVCTRGWYNKPWTSVIRPKNSAVAEKIAKAMEQACANDNIGYDQYQRTTLYTQAKAQNWDISKVTTKCECDCSSLVAVCVNAAGIAVSKDIYTGNERSALEATGGFTIHTEAKYIGQSSYLKRGDILLGNGHTAVVLSNGASATTSTKPAASAESNLDKKTVEELAKEVMAGKWGNDWEWQVRLTNAVQDAVNAILNKPVYHTVQAGETLSYIASKHNTTYTAIAKLNGIKNPDMIYAGQKLRIK